MVEVVVVMAILAIIAGIAAVSLQQPLRGARLETACESILVRDEQLREHSRRAGQPAELTIDLGRGTLVSQAVGKSSDSHVTQAVGQGVRIDQVRTADRRVDFGRIAIRYSSQGQTETFGLRLRSGSTDGRWVIFLGPTGQPIQVQDDREADNIFGLIAGVER